MSSVCILDLFTCAPLSVSCVFRRESVVFPGRILISLGFSDLPIYLRDLCVTTDSTFLTTVNVIKQQQQRPEESVLIIPVVVDRSNNSTFYIIAFGAVGVFIILSVLGLQKQIGSKPFLCATLRKNIKQEKLLCMRNAYNFVG